MIKQAVIVAGLVCLVLLLAACGTPAQSPADGDHLGRFAAEAAVAKGQAIDPAARKALLSDPALRFPARIGLARLETGAVSAVPQSEAESWLAMVKELGPGWGEFVPISPTEVASIDGDGAGLAACRENAQASVPPCGRADIAATLRSLRRIAARQHLDAVLIYEVVTGDRQGLETGAIAELAPIHDLLALLAAGGAGGQAQGLLMGARDGAIYGFAAAGDGSGEPAAKNRAGSPVEDLAEETGMMLRDLRIELAEARAARAEAENRSAVRAN